jgi:hypothetical protein
MPAGGMHHADTLRGPLALGEAPSQQWATRGHMKRRIIASSFLFFSLPHLTRDRFGDLSGGKLKSSRRSGRGIGLRYLGYGHGPPEAELLGGKGETTLPL